MPVHDRRKLFTSRSLLALIVIVVAFLVALVAVTGSTLGVAGSAVIQGLSVAASIYGGVVFAREGNSSAVVGAAVKSVRRVFINYEALGRLAENILRVRSDLETFADERHLIRFDLVDMALLQLSDVVVNQIESADVAVLDWRDLAPAEVADEIEALRSRKEGRS